MKISKIWFADDRIYGLTDDGRELWQSLLYYRRLRNATDEERAEMVADIERSFNESINRPDYARKLYLIENCIYGVDIQPIDRKRQDQTGGCQDLPDQSDRTTFQGIYPRTNLP